ncbi:MAG: Na+/H+ antiporter subunit E [Acetobacteraceae bacterium]|nr:Na+/H+ antiporter subunit E [Acetobacteraceae bacterium]
MRSATIRAAAFAVLWLVLAGAHWADLPAATIAVIAATWTSLRLLPPGVWRVSRAGVAGLLLRLPWQSLLAGVTVGRLALDPRTTMRPGFVRFRPALAPGGTRDAFCALMGVLPGTLPAGPDERDALFVHCTDVGQPVAAQLAEEEARFVRAVGGTRGHG